MLKYLVIIFCLGVPALVSARWIEDAAQLENPAIGSVRFSHYQHLEAVGNDCVLCHNRLFHIDASKNRPVSMAEMELGKSCGGCHNGDKAFSVSGQCASCHPTGEIRFKVAEGDALFSHEIHSGIYSCNECHPGLFAAEAGANQGVSMEQMSTRASCGACHDGNSAFSVEADCETCHDM